MGITSHPLEDEGFLLAIKKNPYDKVLRQVYTDYLEEQNRLDFWDVLRTKTSFLSPKDHRQTFTCTYELEDINRIEGGHFYVYTNKYEEGYIKSKIDEMMRVIPIVKLDNILYTILPASCTYEEGNYGNKEAAIIWFMIFLYPDNLIWEKLEDRMYMHRCFNTDNNRLRLDLRLKGYQGVYYKSRD